MGLLVSVVEAGDPLLELNDEAVLLIELVAHVGDLRLQLRDARVYGHGGDLPREIQLVVRIRRYHGQDVVPYVEIRLDTAVRHT